VGRHMSVKSNRYASRNVLTLIGLIECLIAMSRKFTKIRKSRGGSLRGN
jgi:hypothetical protein